MNPTSITRKNCAQLNKRGNSQSQDPQRVKLHQYISWQLKPKSSQRCTVVIPSPAASDIWRHGPFHYRARCSEPNILQPSHSITLKVHFNIILPSKSVPIQCLFLWCFPTETFRHCSSFLTRQISRWINSLFGQKSYGEFSEHFVWVFMVNYLDTFSHAVRSISAGRFSVDFLDTASYRPCCFMSIFLRMS